MNGEAELGGAAFSALAVVSVVAGAAVLFVMRTFSDQAAIARTKNRLTARLLEFRLFGDEPLLVLRAQRAVVVESLRLMKLLLAPAVILTVPMVLLFGQLDAKFGKAPLAVGEAGVVTVAWGGSGPAPRLEASEEIAVESPAVRVPGERQVSWRVRSLRAGPGVLRVIDGGQVSSMPAMPDRPALIYGWPWVVWFLVLSGATVLAGKSRRPTPASS